MKSAIGLLMVLFFCSAANAQKTWITGKWKVIQVNNGVICDFKANTVKVDPAFAESLKGNPDSAQMIASFTWFGKRYENYYFIFHENNIYEEVMNGEVRNGLATYSLLEAENLIYMRAADSVNNMEQSMVYDLRKDGVLELNILFGDRKLTIDLERADLHKKD